MGLSDQGEGGGLPGMSLIVPCVTHQRPTRTRGGAALINYGLFRGVARAATRGAAWFYK